MSSVEECLLSCKCLWNWFISPRVRIIHSRNGTFEQPFNRWINSFLTARLVRILGDLLRKSPLRFSRLLPKFHLYLSGYNSTRFLKREKILFTKHPRIWSFFDFSSKFKLSHAFFRFILSSILIESSNFDRVIDSLSRPRWISYRWTIDSSFKRSLCLYSIELELGRFTRSFGSNRVSLVYTRW